MLRTRIHRTPRTWVISAMLLAVPCLAIAQEAAGPATPAAGSRAIPRPDELEPGVNTTPAAPAVPSAAAATAAPAATTASAATAAPAPVAGASAAKPAP